MTDMKLDWNKIQDKWQNKWQTAKIGSAKVNSKKDKFMMIFAYPGISGFLHVGHMRGYSYADAICRLERMKGKQVMFPVGTHASGNHAFAFANKVKNKDEMWVNYLLRNGCTEEKLKELEDPNKVIGFFNEVYVNDYWKKFGFIADWDRFTCTTYPDYEKFIQWQFRKLKEKDLLTQKPYFATACVNCGPVAVDPSETDISKGGCAEKNEYTLLKFRLNEDDINNDGKITYLVAATLRPETVYGQTNLWINPDAKYVKIEVGNENDSKEENSKSGKSENWILSEEASEKLSHQIDEITFKGEVDVETLLGRNVLAPGVDREIPILPSSFCNPKVGSGVVTSVPSDAPFDYIALKTLQDKNSPERIKLKELGVPFDIVDEIKLIPIIKSQGYGDFPAKDICERMNITSLEEKDKLEEATKEIYKVGFHTGVMMNNCGNYGVMRVTEAKDKVKEDLIILKKASVFHDLSEEVVCRCGGKVIIKRIDDQWFIKYSDSELTERSKEQVNEMKIFPKEYQGQMPGVLDWFTDRACARLGNWMGSKFPLDDKWTVEPISDSTLYPSYYIVSKYVNEEKLEVSDLTEEFFDYVFLVKEEEFNEKKIEEIKKRVGEDKFKVWEQIKVEFDYFYPLDINLGGKEHKTVHFPVFIMNHVAILPENKWPRGIFVNWWVTGKGSKISKSKGGAEPIPQAIEKFGVDAMRLYYSHIGSPHIDVVWEEEVVLNYKNALEKISTLFEELSKLNKLEKNSGSKEETNIDLWIKSEFNKTIKKINLALEDYSLRVLASETYYTIPEMFKWYVRRGGNNWGIVKYLLSQWVKLMNPVSPHLSEELAEEYKLDLEEKFVSTSSWPEFNEKLISDEADAGETLIKNSMEGMRNVIKLAKVEKANKFRLFVTEEWKYELFSKVKIILKESHNLGEVMSKIMGDESLKKHGKDVSKIVGMLMKDKSKIPGVITSQEKEFNAIVSCKDFLTKEFDAEIEIIIAEGSDEVKAKQAMPGKLGILLE
ncbi:leucine--tRNA ligase [archaeon]|jgi:leucyl-tRNA synthetase|nr:leucine--tRNA ligase [archaeon]MBT3450552.1 leucine--tRNA ligase [archaeon]MBT6868524.1 leucine--tRNA ligase [archaeon]MBT7193058.1 leucine--tRNA ligase [archaeon]MBT7381147.1 leucine--tRNA ligase [archaeon]